MNFLSKLFGRKDEPPPGSPSTPSPEGGSAPTGTSLPAASPAPATQRQTALNLAELWHVVEEIAREDGHKGRPAVEHYTLTSEGKKDVDRWMQIHLKRLNPEHPFRLPAHHPRHRGYCLIPRLWPDGLRWLAVDDETLFRAPIPEELTREALVSALNAFLDGGGSHSP